MSNIHETLAGATLANVLVRATRKSHAYTRSLPRHEPRYALSVNNIACLQVISSQAPNTKSASFRFVHFVAPFVKVSRFRSQHRVLVNQKL